MKKLASDSLIDEVFASSIKHAVDSVIHASICHGECVTDKDLIREGWGSHTGGSVDWHDCLNIIGRVEIFIKQATPLFILEATPENLCKADPLEFFEGVTLVLANDGGPQIFLDLKYEHGLPVNSWHFHGKWGDESFSLKSPPAMADYLGYNRDEVQRSFNDFEKAIKCIVAESISPPKVDGFPLDSRSIYFHVNLESLNDTFNDEDNKISPEIWERFKDKARLHADEEKLLDSLASTLLYFEKHYS